MVTYTLEELDTAADLVISKLSNQRKAFFYGEIGAGKTTLIKRIGQKLQIDQEITSPTYSLINQYSFEKNGQPQMLNHIDLYRLKDIEEALALGIEDLLEDDSYCFIEWPERLEAIAPLEIIKIKITHNEDSSRNILFL